MSASMGRFLIVAVLAASLLPPGAFAPAAARASALDDPGTSTDRLMGLSLEELVNVKVTSVSKREEPWFQTPAAVTVLTAADIERSGARSIPEILRLVPGMEVARMDGNKWAVSARGFNARFATKMLVLVDGHSVYTPLFSGVLWDAQETIVDDIERIEVIRGPGATLWGTNALNGVINVITKDSQESGAVVHVSSGTVEKGYAAATVGGDLGRRWTYRVFGLGFRRDAYPTLADGTRFGDWQTGRGGVRMDWNPDPRNHVTLGGNVQTARESQLLTLASLAPPYAVRDFDDSRHEGQSAMGRWTRTFSPTSEGMLQVNVDHTDRTEGLARWRQRTVDVDLQHSLALNANHETVVGASYRLYSDDIRGSSITSFPDPRRTEQVGSVFLHHEIHPANRRAALVLGSTFEKPDYAKGSVQPTVRAWCMPTARQVVWVSGARAVRTPSRGERGADIVLAAFPDPGMSGLTLAPTMIGTNELPNETVTSWEAGWRVHALARLTLDAAVYQDRYTALRSLQAGAPEPAMAGGVPYVLLPLYAAGTGSMKGRGAEVSVWADLAARWRVRAGYAFARLEDVGTPVVSSISAPWYPPRHSGWVRSMLDLDRHWSLDGTLRATDHLPMTTVPAYTEMDARLAWHPSAAVEVAVLGENLLHSSHVEFGRDLQYENARIERSVRLSVRLRR